jgi:RNA polymerase sigma-54 factor
VKPTLQLGIGQQLTMTPQLQQAIRLLQLSSIDLQQEIQAALEKNPLLELTEPEDHVSEGSERQPERDVALTSTLPSEEKQSQEPSSDEPTNWDAQTSFQNKHNNYQKSGNEIERLASNETSLQDHLIWQMQLTPFSDTDKLIATLLIDSITEDGYLENSIESIHSTLAQDSELEIDPEEVAAVLQRIQQFDPISVGARNLSECLNIQLRHLSPETPWRDEAAILVTSHLKLLAQRDYPALKRKLGVSMDDLKQVIFCIRTLNPKPGRTIGNSTAEYITPDVYLFKKNKKWVVELNPECTPHININTRYASLIKRADNSRDNQFLKGQLQEAKWFLKSIENRHDTLLKVAKCIVDEQDDFFELGETAMKPLILHQIAEKVEMHESTISRVTTQKFIHTPRGTYELKYFFSSHVSTQLGGECSATAIRAFIKQLIAEENLKKPLSDLKLSALLADKGITVARRTVAKYREAMSIPPSNERKRLF